MAEELIVCLTSDPSHLLNQSSSISHCFPFLRKVACCTFFRPSFPFSTETMKRCYIFLLKFLDLVVAIPSLPSQTNTRPTRLNLRTVTTTAAPPLNTELCGWLGGDPGKASISESHSVSDENLPFQALLGHVQRQEHA